MLLYKDGGDVRVVWDAAGCPAPDFHFLRGSIGDFRALTAPGMCSTVSGDQSGVSMVDNEWILGIGDETGTIGSWGGTGRDGSMTGWVGMCGTSGQDPSGTCP